MMLNTAQLDLAFANTATAATAATAVVIQIAQAILQLFRLASLIIIAFLRFHRSYCPFSVATYQPLPYALRFVPGSASR